MYHVYSNIFRPGAPAMLAPDIQCRCLSYLLRTLPEIVAVPPGVRFALFVPMFPGPYPAIGMTEDPPDDGPASVAMSRMARAIGEELGAYCDRIGSDRLVALAATEADSWAGLLKQARSEWEGEWPPGWPGA